MARNPAVMQEMMRNQDRALSNLEVNCFAATVPHHTVVLLQDCISFQS